jgi:hypothetical protein
VLDLASVDQRLADGNWPCVVGPKRSVCICPPLAEIKQPAPAIADFTVKTSGEFDH